MNRLLLLIVLITVVYSWEDCKHIIIFLAHKIAKQKYSGHPNSHIDEVVGTALILAILPVNIVYLLSADGSFKGKFAVVLIELLAVGIVSQVSLFLATRFTKHYHIESVWTLVSGLFTPSLRVLGQIIHNGRLFRSYILHLMVPIIVGVILEWLVSRIGITEFSARLNLLTFIAATGLMIIVVMNILEKFFRRHHFSLFSYFRIILGIVILVVLAR